SPLRRAIPIFAGDPLGGAAGGTAPEQVHTTFGADPARSMVVSWAAPQPQPHPVLRIGPATHGPDWSVPAHAVTYRDGLNGQITHLYHAVLHGLQPQTAYAYQISDGGRQESTFGGSFATAPGGRANFRFTSFGDLATPNAAWMNSSPNSAPAVRAVESFAPLFHLLNGDLCYANLNLASQPQVWRDFGNNLQYSAAHRPWMPCLGNHEVEFGNGPHGFDAYLHRFLLPDNGLAGLRGHFYAFQVGSVLFVSLDADDVIYEDSGAFTPSRFVPPDGAPTLEGGTSLYVREYSGRLAPGPGNTLTPGANRQTAWLERTLAAARRNPSIDWIVAQMHQNAISSTTKNTSDLGIRQAWQPLFDRYQVDLVVTGHAHDYERSFPLRGSDHGEGRESKGGAAVDTNRPRPASADANDQTIDTTQGTVYLVLGGGGTNLPSNVYGTDPANGRPQAQVTVERAKATFDSATGLWSQGAPQAVEDAVWSAKRDVADAYGLAVFDVDPGQGPWDRTSITMRYYHAPAATSAGTTYTLFDEVVLKRPRQDALVRTSSGRLEFGR
ncbi:MAG: metallophosphoesterase family protein, partial [Candidatus Dormibacteraeota bacterium]|nr:metallophosphoesterase family protein [Candidatus Dormibacteraeota bacterium]